jgi:sucrose-6-phosphate hydrolase SacC (GH32 family)
MPREIKLFKTKEKYNLVSKPVEEMDSIIQVTKIIAPEKVSAKTTIAQGPTITKIKCKLLKPKQGSIYFNFSNKKGESVQVGYKSYASQWYIDRTKSGNTSFSTFFPGIHYAPEPLPELKSTEIEIWLDRSSIEVFIDDGRLVMTDIFFSEEGLDNLELISEDGAEVEILSGSVGYR